MTVKMCRRVAAFRGFIFLLAAAGVVTAVAAAEAIESSAASDVCVEIRKSSKPVAILIDPEGRISAGPAMLGSVPVSSDFVSDAEQFSSGFRVVVSPNSIRVRNVQSGGFSVQLMKVKPICAKSSTYAVNLKAEFKGGGGIRPYKFEDGFPELYIVDGSGYETDATRAYRFDHRLLGEFVEPRAAVSSKKK